MENKYVIPKETFKTTYKGLLKGLLVAYVNGYSAYMPAINPEYVVDKENPKAVIIDQIKNTVISSYTNSAPIISTTETIAKVMTEARVKKDVLTKVGNLTAELSKRFANSFNIDQDKIASAFSLNFSENELARVVSAMMNKKETNQKTNLMLLGYQDLDEPTYISFYFKSFDGK